MISRVNSSVLVIFKLCNSLPLSVLINLIIFIHLIDYLVYKMSQNTRNMGVI